MTDPRTCRPAALLTLACSMALWAAPALGVSGCDTAVQSSSANPDGGESPDASGEPSAAGTEYAPYLDVNNSVRPAGFVTLGDLDKPGSPVGLRGVTLAFVLGNDSGAGQPCTPVTTAGQDALETTLKAEIDAFVKNGGKVKVAFGGANGTYLESDRACKTADALLAALDGFVQRTGLTDLDFDVEQAAEMTAAINQKRSQALKKLQDQRPAVRISLTVASLPRDKNNTPGGMTESALGVVRSAVQAGVRLSHVNLMTMDFGPYFSSGQKMGDLAISALSDGKTQLKGVLPDATDAQLYKLLGVTPMIGVNDVGTEIFSLDDARALVAYVQQNRLGLLGYWSLSRDQACASRPSAGRPDCSDKDPGGQVGTFAYHKIFSVLQ